MQKAIEYESGSKAILLLARVNFFLSVLRIRIYYRYLLCGSGSRIQKMSICIRIRILVGKDQKRKITPKKIQLNLSK